MSTSKMAAQVTADPFCRQNPTQKKDKKNKHHPTMASKPPLSPTPRRRQRAAIPSTAAKATDAVTAVTLPAAGIESPTRPAALFASAHKTKRGKPKTTPERGCLSPQKKKTSRRKLVGNNSTVHFKPTVVTDSSRGPSPVSVAPSANPFLAQFPTVRDRDAFARQSNYIAMAKLCKRFLLALGAKKGEVDQIVYQSARQITAYPENTRIYEMSFLCT